MASEPKVSSGAATYRNGVLTLICALLVLLCVRGLGGGGIAGEAQASGARGVPMIPNAAAQRLQMIEELKQLSQITQKLGEIESTMDARLREMEQRLAEQTSIMKIEQRSRGRSEERNDPNAPE